MLSKEEILSGVKMKHQIKIKHECFGVLCKGNQSMTIKIKKETLDKITQDYYGDRK